ncbi:hypothetical protein GH714_018444 [Hevea brasiliensis]|uniref:TIR domain-containing protein n=1 Tax=Hevea brasiliensis TaxID=3981 RepID=A0A6A6L9K8_HEVBR|nr:hypothetical protein GH714_018444 [Hevea brasiliensis]
MEDYFSNAQDGINYDATMVPSSSSLSSKVEVSLSSRPKKLATLPNLSSATNLERINLKGCESLLEIPSSIQFLHKLVYLNLDDCIKLGSLPILLHLKHLKELSLSFCINLKKMSEIPSGIKQLHLIGCGVEEWSASVQSFDTLKYMCISMCYNLRSLPSSLHLTFVEKLELFRCSNLNKFPSVTGYLKRILLEEGEDFIIGLPGSEIPEWFSYENLGSSIDFVLPPECINAKYLCFTFCVVLEFKVPFAMEKHNNFVLRCELRLKMADGMEVPFPIFAPDIYDNNVHFVAAIESDHVFLHHYGYNFQPWLKKNFSEVNKLSIESDFKIDNFHKGDGGHFDLVESKLKRCGIHLLYAFKDEEFQCSPSTIQTKLSLQYASTVSNFMQQDEIDQ